MPIRSLRNRLALIFGLIVLCAIAIIYFAVAPQLEGRLRDQKLDNLAADARRYSPPLLSSSAPTRRSHSSPARSTSPPRARAPRSTCSGS